MKAQINISETTVIQIDLSKPISLSIPIKNGTSNPNCYGADPVKFETIVANKFVGSVAKGGAVNYQKLQLTPHGNGTHTECYGHITASKKYINKQLTSFHFYSKLISVKPIIAKNGDSIIELTHELKAENWQHINALIIRTLPNSLEKLTNQYSGTNPPYISRLFIDFLVTKGIEHLLIDLPSVDKEVDQGALLAHRAFWGFPNYTRERATITELIYVPNEIKDGCYLLNLQTIDLEMDACPSRPILYKIEKNISISND